MQAMAGELPWPWRLGRNLIDLIYPPACALCGLRLHPFEQTVCETCRRRILTESTWRCRRCGATGAGESPSPGAPCRFCPPPGACYQGVLSATRYTDASALCVARFKYQRRLELGRLMADMTVARLAEPIRDLEDRVGWVAPVPLHWLRRARRGFNQSHELARRLAHALALPLKPGLLRRRRYTRPQVRVARERRAENVRGAFVVGRAYRGAPLPGVLLVDDVVTTGATVGECARVLTEAGAAQVWVASFARA